MNDRRDFVWSFGVMKRSTPAKPGTAARWKIQSEYRNLSTDILSARCIVDRLRMQSDLSTIAQIADRDDVKRMSANVGVIAEFVRNIAEIAPDQTPSGQE